MKSLFVTMLVLTMLLIGTALDVFATGHAGIVKSFEGEVTISRNNQVFKAEPNFRLMEGDVIETGADGKAGLILEDDTVVSMGFNSRIAIKKFMFEPNDKKLSLICTVFQGTISFISGQIAKLMPGQVRIETPYATVGSRGTHMLIQVN